jgi:hypothetical protein
MIAGYMLVLAGASLVGDAYAAGEPDSTSAWLIVEPVLVAPSERGGSLRFTPGLLPKGVRIFASKSDAWKWKAARARYQRARGRHTSFEACVVPVGASRVVAA